jgi:plastocyanin
MADANSKLDRRGFLGCMAWVGTAAVWTVSSGVLRATALGETLSQMPHAGAGKASDLLRFVQISDSHIGFDKAANPDVTATLRDVAARIKALPDRPSFILHTGDLTHLSRPTEFDTVEQVLRETGLPVFYVPGEHDVLSDDGKDFRARFGKDTIGDGWYSFNHDGVHFVGLVNVLNLKAGGLGTLGDEQLAWLERDLKPVRSSTPVVVFAHIPLWSVYPEWGWGTGDSERALALLKRFGSVSVLNGHIHQIMQKVEGHVTFHTAMSTAFPQPAPGTAPSPGPMKVEPARLRQLLGLSRMSFHDIKSPIAITDVALSVGDAPMAAMAGMSAPAAAAPRPASSAAPGALKVDIDNFKFSPETITVPRGATVTWTNHDDVPHTVTSTTKAFGSAALDTDGQYSHPFDAAGTFEYYCTLHPRMTGKVVVS